VAPADADVNDIANALAGMALPCASPHSVGKVSHLVEHGVDRRDHIFTINDDGGTFWGTQSDMQDSPVFRDIDLLTPEHGVDPVAWAGFVGQLQEPFEWFGGDAVLGVIQVKAHGLRRHALGTLGVVRKEFSEMQIADILMMGLKGLPCLTFSKRCD